MKVEKFNNAVGMVEQAMQNGRIGFALQQVNAVDDSRTVLYSECLGRLIEPDGTIRTAPEFTPVLHAARRSAGFDRHMLSLAFEWLSCNPSTMLGCNISAENISPQNWTAFYELLFQHRLLASRLVLEITESMPITPLFAAAELLQIIRGLGYKIAVDDFGTGYSTTELLFSIPVDIVKIDAFFVRHRRDDSERFLRHMVGLASCAASTVIVEGIETYAQFEAAKTAGATHVQGFLLSEPTLAPVYCGSSMPLRTAGMHKWVM
jgi:EAL domain-containing protein (putative c-di-GMP-specific phosphodiesterase class I)